MGSGFVKVLISIILKLANILKKKLVISTRIPLEAFMNDLVVVEHGLEHSLDELV